MYSLPYNPQLNPIENVFSQLKSYVKNKSPDTYNELKSVIDKIIKEKITKEHLENYYKYLFTQANDFINKISKQVSNFSVKKVKFEFYLWYNMWWHITDTLI